MQKWKGWKNLIPRCTSCLGRAQVCCDSSGVAEAGDKVKCVDCEATGRIEREPDNKSFYVKWEGNENQ